MESSILKKAEEFLLEKVRHKRWQKIVAVLAAVVILVTVWVLLKPATATTKQTYCGFKEEHTHTDECYERILICEKAGTEGSTGGTTSGGSSDNSDSEDSSSEGENSGDSDTEGTEPGTSTEGDSGTTDGTEPGTSTENGTQSGTTTEGTGTDGTTPDNMGTSPDTPENGSTSSSGSDTSSPAGDSSVSGGASTGGDTPTGGDTSGGASSGDSTPAPSVDAAPSGDVAPADGGVSSAMPSAEGQQFAQISLAHYLSDGTQGMEAETGAAGDAMSGDGQSGGDLPVGTGEEHVHTDECYEKKLICEKEEHIHEALCYIDPALPQADKDRILYAAGLIDALPEYEEIAEILAGYEESGDEEGYQSYFVMIAEQALCAYTCFEDLGVLQNYIRNRERVLVLSSLWEAVTLEISDGNCLNVKGVDVTNWDPNAATLYSKTFDGNYSSWHSFHLTPTENEKVYKITEIRVAGKSHVGEVPPPGGLILFIFQGLSLCDSIQMGDYVELDFNYKDYSGKSNEVFGTATIGSEYEDPKAKEERNNGLVPIETANTAGLIEINLYDYDSNINTKYYEDTNTSPYPGFKNPAAVNESIKSYGWSSFGDVITTDMDVLLGSSSQPLNETGINRIYKESPVKYGNINLPTSMLPGDAGKVMSTKLKDDYPALAGKDGKSLAYLFGGESVPYVTRQNQDNLDGLFQYNAKTGWYSFNSMETHAQYNPETNRFEVYDARITSNYALYPFGNFLPFNDIQKAKQVSTIDLSIENDYYTEMANSARYKAEKAAEGSTENIQYQKLASGIESERNDKKGKTGLDILNEYYIKEADKATPVPIDQKKTFTEADAQSLYNIDFDDATNFFFGMSMEMRFMQPVNGKTGPGNDDPMIFRFSGDDDVWIYVDGVLFLDLSGIHRQVGGVIDFERGVVEYYALTNRIEDIDFSRKREGNINDPLVKTVYFKDLPGINTALLNEKGTFQNNSAHTMNFYYMERGAGSGVCRMEFNFPLLEKNSLAVGKTLSVNNEEVEDLLGSPSFDFQVLQALENGEKPLPGNETLFIAPGTEYEIFKPGKCNKGEEEGHIHTAHCQFDVVACGKGSQEEHEHDSSCYITYTGTGVKKKVGEDGIFSLKKGEYAVFSDISVVGNGYYVRELLDKTLYEQYGNISVDGQTGTQRNDIQIGDREFVGTESEVYHTLDGSTSFYFDNKVDVTKLSSLSLTKEVKGNSWSMANEKFQFKVRFGDQWLRAGTTYTVTYSAVTANTPSSDEGFSEEDVLAEDSDGTAEDEPAEKEADNETSSGTITIEERVAVRGELDCSEKHDHANECYIGLIELKHGETVTFDKILAGTEYWIQELVPEDYQVEYEILSWVHQKYGPKIVTEDDKKHIEGTVSVVNDHIQLKAINTDKSEVKLPMEIPILIRKELQYPDGGDHTYQFQLEQVDKNGTLLGVTTKRQELKLTVSGAAVEGNFSLLYSSEEFLDLEIGDSEQQYFKVTEMIPDVLEEELVQNGFTPVFDKTVYLLELTITRISKNEIAAKVIRITRIDETGTEIEKQVDENGLSNITLHFRNAIESDLTIGKWINGNSKEESEFTFDITLNPPDTAPEAFDEEKEFSCTKGRIDDLLSMELMASTNSAISSSAIQFTNGVGTVTLQSGEYIKIHGLPYGVTWKVEEKESETESSTPYYVSYLLPDSQHSSLWGKDEALHATRVEGAVAEGALLLPSTEGAIVNNAVTFVNTTSYSLPETGGFGTATLYTMAGIGLVLVACLLYRKKFKERRI